MKNRKILKNTAKKSVKKHYFRNVLIVFIASLIIAGGYQYSTVNTLNDTTKEVQENANALLDLYHGKKTNSEIIDELLNKSDKDKEKDKEREHKYNNGILAVFFNQISESDSFVFGIINAFNHLFFDGNISVFVNIILTSIVLLAIYLLVQNVIVIGKNRYFLEQRKYRDTKIDKLLFPYRVRKTLRLARILLVKYVCEFLWNLTIIGGIIKHYEYLMVPYLLAENPNIKQKEVFKLSKEMMNGNKFNVFKLDFSLIGWYFLGLLTFNLSNVFYFDVYKECLYAELYMDLRNKVKDKYSHLLNDTYLEIEEEKEEEYPTDGYKIPLRAHRKWLNVDYRRNYSITNYILFFFSFAIVGWLYEVTLHLINYGVFVNRGTLIGPWLPIYGWGGILILFFLKPIREHPVLLFVCACILSGFVEYGTAWYLEAFHNMKWWDYSGYFMNLNGKICLEGLLVFGLAGCTVTYLIAPLLDNLFNLLKGKIKIVICTVLIIIYGTDFIYSTIHPHTGKGITTEVKIVEDGNIVFN